MRPALRRSALFPVFALVIIIPIAHAIIGCTHYGDPRAELIVTSNRNDATIYLVPIDKELVKPLTRDALKQYNMGSTSSQRGIWVNHGYYWLVLEEKGNFSGPIEFEVRLDNLNKVHVDF